MIPPSPPPQPPPGEVGGSATVQLANCCALRSRPPNLDERPRPPPAPASAASAPAVPAAPPPLPPREASLIIWATRSSATLLGTEACSAGRGGAPAAAGVCFIWRNWWRPGFFLLGIDLVAAAIFITCCFWTVQRAEELRRLGQRSFLMQIGIAFGAYLLLMPITVDISAETLDPWAREKWIRTIQMCLTLAAHCGMLFLIWPSRAETHFLVAGNFKAAASGGFASPFASGGDADPGGGGGLGESLLDEPEDAFYGGF